LRDAENHFSETEIYKILEAMIPHQTLFKHQLGYV